MSPCTSRCWICIRRGIVSAGFALTASSSSLPSFSASALTCASKRLVSAAFKADQQVVRPVRPDTIAKSLAIGNPADGVYVLDVCRRTGGTVEDVTDDQIREGILLLARNEGIFTETAGGTTVGVLKKLVETGALDPTLETVVINTGMGLKTLDAVRGSFTTHEIEPTVAAFEADVEQAVNALA